MKDALAHLPVLTACCWVTAVLGRPAIEAARAAATAHGPGAAVISTCQRLEAYSLGPCDCAAPSRLHGLDALRHLAAVASGLHSIVLGESQVLGQVREGLGLAGGTIRAYGDLAVASARELRRDQGFTSHAGHLLDRALDIHPVPGRGRALVLGRGPMGRLIARRALALGFAEVFVASRRALPADEPGLTSVALDAVRGLPPVDVVIGCLGSDAPELDQSQDLPQVRDLILDLGTPRNFGGQAPVPTLAIASLMAEATPHRDAARTRLLARVHSTLDNRLASAAEDGESTVGALRREVERQRQAEVARILRKNPEIPAATVDTITRALVGRLFHTPSERLRALDPCLGRELVDLFRVETEEEPAQ